MISSGGEDEESLPETSFAWPPSAPASGEGLLGWLLREASDQHLPSISLVLARGTSRLNLRPEQRVGARLDVDALADATLTKPTVIDGLLYPQLDDQRVSFLQAAIPTWHIASRNRRFSPRTLAEKGYYLAAWEHKFLPFCPSSYEYLTDRCPHCAARQVWHWAVGVAHCPRCGCELTSRSRRTVPSAWRARLDVVAGLTTGAPPSRYGELIPAALHEADPGDVLELIHALFPLCGARGLTISYSRWWQRHPVQLASTLADAVGLLEDWPCRLLERITALGGRNQARDPRVADVIKGSRLRPDGRAAALMCKLASSMQAHGSGRLPGSDMAYSIKTATLKLGEGTAKMAEARRDGRLRSSPMLRRGELVLGFDRAEIDELVRSIAQRTTVWKSTSVLGLPHYAVQELVERGELATFDHPYITHRFGVPTIDARSVADLIGELEARSSNLAITESWTPLRRVMTGIGGGPKPWAETLRLIRCGELRVRVEVGAKPVTRRISVPETDAADIAALNRPSACGGHASEPILILSDVLEVLNLDYKRYPALFSAAKGRREMTVGEACALATQFITTAEITARLGVDPRAVAMRLRRLEVLETDLGWPRGVVEPQLPQLQSAARRRKP